MVSAKRLISTVLVICLLLGLSPVTAFAAESEAGAEEVAVSDLSSEKEETEEEPGEPVSDAEPEPAQEETEEVTQEPVEPATEAGVEEPTQPEEEPAPEEESAADDPTQAQETEDEPPEEEPSKEDPSETVTSEEITESVADEPLNDSLSVTEKTLALRYDDRYSFADAYPGYSILQIETKKVWSYRVEQGMKTDIQDAAVLITNGKSDTDVIAVGTGVARVLLVPGDSLARAKKALQAGHIFDRSAPLPKGEVPIPCISVTVTVKAAKLTLFFLAGQSNMEGLCNGGGWARDSIVCTPGTVYSTYLPAAMEDAGRASYVAGGRKPSPLTSAGDDGWEGRVQAYLPASLTSNSSLKKTALAYPLNALTGDGSGKTGPDSAIGYEWNRLTGDKVWLVNVAWSGSSIRNWQPGKPCFERAFAAMQQTVQIYWAELSAGHFERGTTAMYWLQGEADRTISAENYTDCFESMLNGLKQAGKINYTGIISVRSAMNSQNNYQGAEDLYLTGPRISQYAIAADANYPTVFMVSNANESWIGDQEVKDYFSDAYPGGRLDYPGRAGANRTLPVTAAAVHSYIHYTQLGHNENGLTAARGMYEAIQGSAKPQSVTWRYVKGNHFAVATVLPRKSIVAVPVVSPVYTAKKVKLSYDTKQVRYTPATGALTSVNGAYTTVTASYGKTALSTMTMRSCASPAGLKAVNTTAGVSVSWTAVKNAQKYRVYYRTGNGSWVGAGVTAGTQFLIRSLKSGTNYRFTVRCVDSKVTVFTSGFDPAGVSVTYIAAPVIQRLQAGKGSVTLTWSKRPGAALYRVFYKTANGSWVRAGDTKAVSMSVKNLPRGNYTFTVRCLSADKKSYTSSYYAAGKQVSVSR